MRLTEKASAWANLKGNSKSQIAQALNISPNTLTSRLSEETEWTWREGCKLAKLMDCPIDELAEN